MKIINNFTKNLGCEMAIVCVSLALYCIFMSIGIFDFINIIFYKGILVSIVAAVISYFIRMLIQSFIINRKNFGKLKEFEFSHISSIFFLLMLFHVLIPVSLDRSISVFMLAVIEKHEEGVSKAEIEGQFRSIYLDDYDAFGRRLGEQMASHNIRLQGENFVLTENGKFFMEFSRFVAKICGIDRKFVDPQLHNLKL
jgi:hypothetical protein